MRLRSCRTMPRGGATVKERKPRTYITPHKHGFGDAEQETGGVKCGISEADLTSWSFLRKFRVRRTLHMRSSRVWQLRSHHYICSCRVFGLPQTLGNATGVHTKKAVRLCGLTAFLKWCQRHHYFIFSLLSSMKNKIIFY